MRVGWKYIVTSLKLADQFTYLGSNISSTESDIKIGIEKEGGILFTAHHLCGNQFSHMKNNMIVKFGR